MRARNVRQWRASSLHRQERALECVQRQLVAESPPHFQFCRGHARGCIGLDCRRIMRCRGARAAQQNAPILIRSQTSTTKSLSKAMASPKPALRRHETAEPVKPKLACADDEAAQCQVRLARPKATVSAPAVLINSRRSQPIRKSPICQHESGKCAGIGQNAAILLGGSAALIALPSGAVELARSIELVQGPRDRRKSNTILSAHNPP